MSKDGSASTAQWEKMEGWLTVRNLTQPAFIAVAADDPLLAYASVPIFDAWREAGKS